jgi:hypothetical protein
MREVKRTEEMERQLRYFHSQIHAYNELAPKEGKETLVLAPAPVDVRHLQLDELAVRTLDPLQSGTRTRGGLFDLSI